MLIGKYSFFYSNNTWGCDVLHDQNVSSQMREVNIRRQIYFGIQKDSISEHSFLMTHGCNCLEQSSISDQLKFNPNHIQKLSLSIKQNFENLAALIENIIDCGSRPIGFHTKFSDICNATT
jgi:hypothetical protein